MRYCSSGSPTTLPETGTGELPGTKGGGACARRAYSPARSRIFCRSAAISIGSFLVSMATSLNAAPAAGRCWRARGTPGVMQSKDGWLMNL